MIHVRVGEEDFDVGREVERLSLNGVGGLATFVGIVRGGEGLTSLTLEHYPAMTQGALTAVAEEARARWELTGVTIVHRVGTLIPGDKIVFTGTSGLHRSGVLEACAFLIDRLKTDAPFWKRERFEDGRDSWVEARESDASRSAGWSG